MKSSQLSGKEVVGAGGWKIGKVRGFVFDEHTWRIGALIVGLHRPVAEEYQMRKLLSRTSVEVNVDSIHAVGDTVILSVTKPELRRLVSLASERLKPVAPPPTPGKSA